MLEDTLPSQHAFDQAHLADLFVAVRGLERVSGTDAHLSDDGVVEYWKGSNSSFGGVCICRGDGVGVLLNSRRGAQRNWHRRRGQVATVVIDLQSVTPRAQSPPTSILGLTEADNIIGSSRVPNFCHDGRDSNRFCAGAELIGV